MSPAISKLITEEGSTSGHHLETVRVAFGAYPRASVIAKSYEYDDRNDPRYLHRTDPSDYNDRRPPIRAERGRQRPDDRRDRAVPAAIILRQYAWHLAVSL